MADFKGRGGKPGGFKKSGFGGDRGGYKPREGGFKPRGEGGYKPREGGGSEGGERPARSFGERKPYGDRAPREGGFKPRSEGGYDRKPREGGFKPRGEGGYKPRSEGGYKPREGGFRPREEGGYKPREGGFKPRGEGGYKPRSEGGYKPRAEGGYKPRGEGGYKPREGGYERKTYSESRPPRNYGERDSAPREGGFKPRGEGGYRGRSEGGFKPRSEGGYDRKPREGGYERKPYGSDRPRQDYADRGTGAPRGEDRGGFRERGPRGGERSTHWVEKDPYETAPHSDGWLVGKHPVTAALTAGRRVVKEVWMAAEPSEVAAFQAQFPQAQVKTVSRLDLDKRFPDQVHQGMAAEVGNLPQPDLQAIMSEGPRLIVGLDQVTDPHNFGAILRSSAAFGVGAVIATERRSAGVTSVVAKAAAGALEVVPVVEITNLATTLREVKDAGYKVIGLAGDATTTIADLNLKPTDKVCVVLGSEGDGLRRLTRETCDHLVRIDMTQIIESLNVSVAAGVVLSSLFIPAPVQAAKPAKAGKPAKVAEVEEAEADEAPAKKAPAKKRVAKKAE